MNYYRKSEPSDVRDLGSTYEEWVATGNPKADDWAAVPLMPTYDPVKEYAAWANGSWIVMQLAPIVVSMRSFREACGRDLTIRISAYVASIEDLNERFKAQTDFEFATTVSRAHFRVSQIASALGKTESEIDEVFALAQQLDLN
jgi:hypothetical protein